MTTTAARSRKSGVATRRTAPRVIAALELNPELIRCRAYEIFLGRNGEPGDPLADWVRAERELNGEIRDSSAAVTPADQDTICGASELGPLSTSESLVGIRA